MIAERRGTAAAFAAVGELEPHLRAVAGMLNLDRTMAASVTLSTARYGCTARR